MSFANLWEASFFRFMVTDIDIFRDLLIGMSQSVHKLLV
jgi:hypothetical protein